MTSSSAHKGSNILVLTLFLWMVLAFPSLAASPVELRGGGPVTVSQANLHLGQLVTFSGGDTDLRRKLSQISFGPAPQPGRTKTIDTAEIVRRLKGKRVDMTGVDLQVATPIQVQRRSVTLRADRIEQAVRQFLGREMPWDPKAVRIKAIRGVEGLAVPAGKLGLKVMAPRGSKYLGSLPMAVSIFCDGQFYKKVWATAVIEVRSRVVMVAKPLGRHQPIRADHLQLVDVDLAKVPSQAIQRMEDVVGMRTKRKIFPKTILRKDYVEAPHVVQRGDLVKIVARSSSIQVSAQGITRERGRLGERIRVENIDSKKQVYAVVIDPSTVEVQF